MLLTSAVESGEIQNNFCSFDRFRLTYSHLNIQHES